MRKVNLGRNVKSQQQAMQYIGQRKYKHTKPSSKILLEARIANARNFETFKSIPYQWGEIAGKNHGEFVSSVTKEWLNYQAIKDLKRHTNWEYTPPKEQRNFISEWSKGFKAGNKKLKNPSFFSEDAESISKGFHGREVNDIYELQQTEKYTDSVAQLGLLVELGILTGDSEITPITFEYDNIDNAVRVCAGDRDNIEFVGGNQEIDCGQFTELDKNLVLIGEVLTIAYFADKHHLQGPKTQAHGTEYEHEFGEEGGDLPILLYDKRNCQMLLVGGSYTIADEGIKN